MIILKFAAKHQWSGCWSPSAEKSRTFNVETDLGCRSWILVWPILLCSWTLSSNSLFWFTGPKWQEAMLTERKRKNKVESSVIFFPWVLDLQTDCSRRSLLLKMWEWNASTSLLVIDFCIVGLPKSFDYQCGLGLCNDQMIFSGKARICVYF